jgi:predicted transcriptional regulator
MTSDYSINKWIRQKALLIRAFRLLNSYCLDCGETNIFVLDFHHKNKIDKLKEVSLLIRNRVPWSIIETEVNKCILLCSNCHRKRHSNIALFNKYQDTIEKLSYTIEEQYRWTILETQRLIELYNKGLLLSKIALLFNKHKATVSKKITKLIKLNVINKRNRVSSKRKLNEATLNEVKNLSVSYGVTKIAEMLNLSKTTVYRILKEIDNGE